MPGISEVADVVTTTSIAVVSLSAAGVVVAGLGHAYRSRRRERIVLMDIGELGVPGGEGTPSLSPWLRQRVRDEVQQLRHNARHLSQAVVAGDARALPGELTAARVEAVIASAAQDTLTTLAQGLNAVLPDRTLATWLPRPRGFVVRSMPMARGADAHPRLGLSVELAIVDGPPIAATTFWEPQPGTPDAVHERMMQLIEPAARWIGVRLVAARTEVRAGSDLAAGLHRLLAGGLCRTAMDDFEEYATTFAEDASGDLRSAGDALPGYYRPWEMLAGIQERLGRTYTKKQRHDDAETAYRRGQQAWQQAEKLASARTRPADSGWAGDNPPGDAGRAGDNPPADAGRAGDNPPAESLERLRVRRLKCQVLANRTEERPLVVQELGEHPVRTDGMSMGTLYDAACLYATLAGEFTDDAKDALGRAVLLELGQDVRGNALRDPELLALGGLATFLNRLVAERGPASEPIQGDEAAKLIAAAKE
jgi:hypothetical protein